MNWPKPKLFLSGCFLQPVRYDNCQIPLLKLDEIKELCELKTACPEMAMGMGTPRPTVRLTRDSAGETYLSFQDGEPVQNDFDQAYQKIAQDLAATKFDGAILKSKSPSCGPGDAKLYPAGGGGSSMAWGLFAKRFYEEKKCIIESEARLSNPFLYFHFWLRLFALASLREIVSQKNKLAAGLIAFQSRHKYMLMLYSPAGQKELGRLLANGSHLGWDETVELYNKLFHRVIVALPDLGRWQNTLQHMYGYFKDKITETEKSEFLGQVAELKSFPEHLPVLIAILRNYSHRFKEEYLSSQSLIEPFPAELRLRAPKERIYKSLIPGS